MSITLLLVIGRGGLRASSCDLLGCWNTGIHQAETCLCSHGLIIDFGVVFLNWQQRGIDLLRPLGGKYPGISAEVDRSLGEGTEGPVDIEVDQSFRVYDG